MAYGKDNNRGIQAPSVGFGTQPSNSAEGMTQHTLDTKTGPQNLGGVNDQPKKFFDGSWGEADKAPVFDGEMNEAAQRPSVPTFTQPGVHDISGSFGSVAPYEYGEFPKDTIKVGASANPVPLT